MKKDKALYLLMLFSYLGVGMMTNIVGTERMTKRKTNNFWFKFVFQTMGWLILLFVFPGILFWAAIYPNLTPEGSVRHISEIIFALYIYFSGAFICWWQVRLRERND